MTALITFIVYHFGAPVILAMKVLNDKFYEALKYGSNYVILLRIFLIIITYPIVFVLMIFPGYFVSIYYLYKYITVEIPKLEAIKRKK